jgi:RNA polymerase II subunit A small phosphatase-like protein
MDETMVRSADDLFAGRQPDTVFETHFVYKRPHLEWFLRECAKHYRLAVWSAGQEDYVKHVISHVVPSDIHLEFVWTHDQCTGIADADTMLVTYIKDLKKLKSLGFEMDRVIIVEDKPENCVRNASNAVIVKQFLGEENDEDLLKLAPYLAALAGQPNLQKVDKKTWRTAKPDPSTGHFAQKSRASVVSSFLGWAVGASPGV